VKELSIPKPQSTNYKNQEIELNFDETIILNNPKEQIIITPDVQKKYDIVAKKKKVILKFKDPLKDSTTYTIIFRNAVQDITEKNPAVNLKLAFSTGPYIDSLSLSGKVMDPLTIKPSKEITVAIFQQDTFNIFTDKPSFLTQTDAKGSFTLENLKPGNYYIYGIDDKNRNLIADSKNENYGFNAQRISLTQNKKDITLYLQKLDARPLKLINAKPYNTYFNIKTSKNLTTYKLSPNSGQHLSSAFGDDQSSIKVYNNLNVQDSIFVSLTAVDSINNILDSSFYIKFNQRKVKPEPFTATSLGFDFSASKALLAGTIKFNKPIAQINTDSIYYQMDSLTTIHFTLNDFTLDTLHNILSIEKHIDKALIPKPEEKIAKKPASKEPANTNVNIQKPLYELHIQRSSFISIENDSSEAVKEGPVRPYYFADTGIITVAIQTKEPSYTTQLLDANYKVIRSVSNNNKITFSDLKPGDYQLRLVIDKNNDKVWTPGDFYTHRDAEPTAFYKDSKKGETIIKLKANFELGPLLITY
jgi:uncharacterized protein (DUF2141 family)